MKFDLTSSNSFTGAISLLEGSIFHIRITPGGREKQISALEKYGYLETVPEEAPLSFEDTENFLRIEAEKGSLFFDKKQFFFTLTDPDGETLLQQTSLAFSGKCVSASFKISPREDFAGFGDVSRERYFHRGEKISCWIRNVKSYICVPFFMSTAGYGLLLNSTHKSVFDMDQGNNNSISISDGSGIIDLYLFLGKDFKELLHVYTSVTGRPALPPVWSFGLWHICNNLNNARDAVNDAYSYRQHQIPCDVIGLEPGWMETCYDYSTRKKWDPVKFPLMLEPFKFRKRTFIDAIKYGMGYHFELWLCDNYDLTYEEERRLSEDFEIEKNEVITDNEEFDEHLGRDTRSDKITIPEEPWFEHLKGFVDWGADFFKTDASDQVNNHPDRFYGNGMTDAACHNFYPLMLMRQMSEGFARYTGRRPFIFNPCGWTTFQKWAATWTGDTGGGPATLCGMFNTCFAGHGLTTVDMDANKEEGIHFGYLLPLSQINNYSSWKMPWLWGPKFIELHRFYSSLRSRLIPYLYSCMFKTTQDGIPLLLPPALEFPADPECRKLKHEHLLGPSLLVSSFTREIYFPAGEWKDYWTGKYFDGSQSATIGWPENRSGGLFIRKGAIIPLGPVMQYRLERPVDEVEIYCYPSEEKTYFKYYEDDGISLDHLQGKYALSEITLTGNEKSITLTLSPHEESRVRQWRAVFAAKSAPRRIVSGGQTLPFNWDRDRLEITVSQIYSGITKVEF